MEKITEKTITQRLIEEIDYNIRPGVGCPACHFEFDYHNRFVCSEFRRELHEIINELIKRMKLCNAYGGIRHLEYPPGSVKEQSKILKALLSNQSMVAPSG